MLGPTNMSAVRGVSSCKFAYSKEKVVSSRSNIQWRSLDFFKGGKSFFNNTARMQWKNLQDLVTIGILRFFPQEMRGVCGF